MYKRFEGLTIYSMDQSTALSNQRYLTMEIQEINRKEMSTNSKLSNAFAVLHTERYGNGFIMVYPNVEKIFNSSEIFSLKSLTIKFFDDSGKLIKLNGFDEYYENVDEYKDNLDLIIHPQNKNTQLFISFKVGKFRQDINNRNFC